MIWAFQSEGVTKVEGFVRIVWELCCLHVTGSRAAVTLGEDIEILDGVWPRKGDLSKIRVGIFAP